MTLYLNADPDPVRLQSDVNLRQLVYSLQTLQGRAPLWASTAVKILNFDFNTDLEPSLDSYADSDPVSLNNADPVSLNNANPQRCQKFLPRTGWIIFSTDWDTEH